MNLAEACVAVWVMSMVMIVAVTFQVGALTGIRVSAERQQALYLCQGDLEQVCRALSQGGSLSVAGERTISGDRYDVWQTVRPMGKGVDVVSVTVGYGSPALHQRVGIWAWQAVKAGV